ncbi:MAG: sterol desaturase family protein [Myxococcota bacterium]
MLTPLLHPTSYVEALLSVGLMCMLLTLVGLGMGYGAEAYLWSRGRKVFDVPKRPGQLQHELLGTVLFHLLYVPVMAWVMWKGGLTFKSGLLPELLGFFVPWYGFQFYYYFMHRAMHTSPLYWAHKWHHLSMVTSPMTGFSMHPVETVGWIIGMLVPPVLLSQADLLGFWGFAAFFSMFWTGNIAGHANAEYMAWPSTRLSTIFISNPISYHSLHHARFLGHYSFVCATMDRLMGTEFPDWLAIHRKVFSGHPLQSLHEKGEILDERQ